MMNKPPLGVIPQAIWDDMRYTDILAAIGRYSKAGLEIPDQWLTEPTEINNRR